MRDGVFDVLIVGAPGAAPGVRDQQATVAEFGQERNLGESLGHAFGDAFVAPQELLRGHLRQLCEFGGEAGAVPSGFGEDAAVLG